jgi:hypothetical protein
MVRELFYFIGELDPIGYSRKLIKLTIDHIIALIPCCVKVRFWFLYRYAYKARQHAKSLALLEDERRNLQYQPLGRDAKALSKVLGFDILMLIARDLHYRDILNLSMASKSVYNAMFPKNEIHERVKFLRRYACNDDNRSNCWICGLQTCPVS